MMKGKQFVKKLNALTAVSIFEESSESENESHDDLNFTTTNAQPKQGKVLVEDKCVQTSNENVLSKHDRNTLVIDLDKESNVKDSSDATKVNVNGDILIDVDNTTQENNIFKEVTREKEIVWTKKGASCGAARR